MFASGRSPAESETDQPQMVFGRGPGCPCLWVHATFCRFAVFLNPTDEADSRCQECELLQQQVAEALTCDSSGTYGPAGCNKFICVFSGLLLNQPSQNSLLFGFSFEDWSISASRSVGSKEPSLTASLESVRFLGCGFLGAAQNNDPACSIRMKEVTTAAEVYVWKR